MGKELSPQRKARCRAKALVSPRTKLILILGILILGIANSRATSQELSNPMVGHEMTASESTVGPYQG